MTTPRLLSNTQHALDLKCYHINSVFLTNQDALTALRSNLVCWRSTNLREMEDLNLVRGSCLKMVWTFCAYYIGNPQYISTFVMLSELILSTVTPSWCFKAAKVHCATNRTPINKKNGFSLKLIQSNLPSFSESSNTIRRELGGWGFWLHLSNDY